MSNQTSDPLFLPDTLIKWRSSGHDVEGKIPRDIWTPLEPFFQTLGYTLWTPSWSVNLSPPNSNERAPDGFGYRTFMNDGGNKRTFGHIKAIHCPARTNQNRDVLIRLIAKGSEGLNHLRILRRISSGHIAAQGENHAIPVLREILLDDMVFIVFPLVETDASVQFYYKLHELIDQAIQVLEGVAFLHKNLIAHLDLDIDNILLNFAGGPSRHVEEGAPYTEELTPFRCYFPVRYYINDFELAVCYEPDSDPSTRVVSGLPTEGILIGEYGRPPAPEMLTGAPYCPFKADVWQLGRMFTERSAHVDVLPEAIRQLFSEMASDIPAQRPTAIDALQRLRKLKIDTPLSILDSILTDKPRVT